MTLKQKIDLETIKFFIPSQFEKVKITEQDELDYLKFSERGIPPKEEKMKEWVVKMKKSGQKIDGNLLIKFAKFRETEIETEGYKALYWGKKMRGEQMGEYERGLLEGTMPYWTILGGENPKEILPRSVVDFMKKEMFQGIDREIIEDCYQEVLKHWTWWRRLLFKMRRLFFKMGIVDF